jgi:hypothetical protein
MTNCGRMSLIEIRPHRNGWKVFEAPGVEPMFLREPAFGVSLGRQGWLDYVNFGTYVPRI